MAERFVNIDRETPMLLPPDLREWMPESDLVNFILEAATLCTAGGAGANPRGSGSLQYPPSMMMALLIYCYCHRIFSSRSIERATYDSVAVRYLCGNHHPDHDTIAHFRRTQGPLFLQCFRDVLQLAKASGVLKVGAISLDGTRLAGAGAKSSTKRLADIEAELSELAQTLCAEAEQAELFERDGGGTSLPPELATAAQRRAKLLAAKAEIERRRAQAQAEGRRTSAQSAHQTSTASVSEPESRRLRRGHSGGSVQGYNAQAAVDAGPTGLILGQHLSDEPTENHLLAAGVQSVVDTVGCPTVVLVDKGYEGTERRLAVEEHYGVTVLCPPQRRPTRGQGQPSGSARAKRRAAAQREMAARFEQPDWQTLYARRRVTVEPVFARLKTTLGFTRFHCWGRAAAGAEWTLLCLAHNLRRLNRLRPR